VRQLGNRSLDEALFFPALDCRTPFRARGGHFVDPQIFHRGDEPDIAGQNLTNKVAGAVSDQATCCVVPKIADALGFGLRRAQAVADGIERRAIGRKLGPASMGGVELLK
jgi:hypothetical protein